MPDLRIAKPVTCTCLLSGKDNGECSPTSMPSRQVYVRAQFSILRPEAAAAPAPRQSIISTAVTKIFTICSHRPKEAAGHGTHCGPRQIYIIPAGKGKHHVHAQLQLPGMMCLRRTCLVKCCARFTQSVYKVTGAFSQHKAPDVCSTTAWNDTVKASGAVLE